MNGEQRLERLLGRLEVEVRSAAPVRPLRPPYVRAMWLPMLGVTAAAFVWLTFGPRADLAVLGAWKSFGLSVAQIACGVVLLSIGLRLSIPGWSPSSAAMAWGSVGAVVLHLGISNLTLESSAIAPPLGREWFVGLACVTAIVGLSIAPLVAGAVMLLRGVPARLLPALALVGLSGGLAMESIWRLHCPYSTWDHVLPFHSGALLLATLVALAASAYAKRLKPA